MTPDNEAKAFLYCLRYLINDNMEWLLGAIGDDALYFLLVNSIILIKEKGQYWQLSGKSLEYFFEDLKKLSKSDQMAPAHQETFA